MKPAWLILIGAVGALLVLVPWLTWPRAMNVAARFGADTDTYRTLIRVTTMLDQQCAAGDLAAVDRMITPRFRAELEQRLKNAGKRLGADALRGQVLVGEVAEEDLAVGVSGEDRVVLVFCQKGYRPGEATLFAIRFSWDGYVFLVDKTYSRAAAEDHSRAAAKKAPAEAAEALAAELLAGS